MSPRKTVGQPWFSVSALSLAVCCALFLGAQFTAAQLLTWNWAPEGVTRQPLYPLLGDCGVQSFEPFLNAGDHGAIAAGPYDAIDIWAQRFRADVTAVLMEALDPQLECSKKTEAQSVPGALQNIASKLPPWRDGGDSQTVTREDTGVVLQEYLRAYECALEERRFFLFPSVFQETATQLDSWGLLDVSDLISLNPITLQEVPEQNAKIAREFRMARPTLNRAAGFALGLSRFGELEAQVTCLQRASLDLRNGAALAAQAAAQLPRILDAKDTLRDYDKIYPKPPGGSPPGPGPGPGPAFTEEIE